MCGVFTLVQFPEAQIVRELLLAIHDLSLLQFEQGQD